MDKGHYATVPGDEESVDEETPKTGRFSWLRPLSLGVWFVLFCIAIAMVVVVLVDSFERRSVFSAGSASSSCIDPPSRREWRSLWEEEKIDYIHAVQCLFNTSSVLNDEGTLYDDFVYIHMWIGQKSHNASSFLPWHRMFLHVYETTLIEKCGYGGIMPYWAWDVDWADLSHSSIWNTTNGFGGDGDPNGEITIQQGRCVIEGPFGNTQVLYYDQETYPHCLSRGFINFETQELGSLSGYHFRPEAMGVLTRAPDYNTFREAMEKTSHNAMHWSIRGDFGKYSAANDPLFFLHHAQLDKLWWDWQQAHPEKRLTEYEGKAFNTTDIELQATLDDKLNFMGLWDDVKVSEVMNTNNELLCYRY